MSADIDADIDEAAARWHLAQGYDDMDWGAFTDWLAADRRHREAYDAIALLDARIDAARSALSQVLDADTDAEVRRFPRIAMLGAVAAISMLAIFLGLACRPGNTAPQSVVYRAAAGKAREIALAHGSKVTLSGDSVLRVADAPGAPITLDGKALFDVRHDEAHPLVIRVGGYEVRDIGTRFDIAASGGIVRIAVAEGRIAVRALGQNAEVDVGAGKVATLTEGKSAVDIRPVQLQSVGGWLSGPLVYDDVPLALVAADIGRSTGKPVTIDPAFAGHRFSGVIAPGDRDAMVAAVTALSGLSARTDGDAIRIVGNAKR